MSEVHPFMSAAAWADCIRLKTFSSVEALDYHIDRLSRINPELNAIVVLDLDAARMRAREADAATMRGISWGPLHGVPMTVKESFDVAGLPTTWGVPALRDHRAHQDATAVTALKRAGAVIFGKSNVPTLLADWQTFNPIYGATCNPWDKTRAPGGSSGGAAAALAAGLTPLELGSDIGASVRNPAHYCGVYGHKPSFGIVPQSGHAIPGAEVPLDILVCGPLARSPRDLRTALDAMAGPEPADRPHWQIKLPEPRVSEMRQARVAVWLEDENSRVDDDVKDGIRRVAKAARDAGAQVDEQARPAFDPAEEHSLYLQLLRAATGAILPDETFAQQVRQAAALAPQDDSYMARTLRGATQSHRAWFRGHQRRSQIRSAWSKFFESFDVLLCPPAASAAFPHDQERERNLRTITVNGRQESYNDQLFWAGLASLSYLPATVAPAGLTKGGLPVGVQIIGPYLNDKTTIEFAALLEAEVGGFQPPPAFR